MSILVIRRLLPISYVDCCTLVLWWNNIFSPKCRSI